MDKRMNKVKGEEMTTNRALNEDVIFDELTTKEKTHWFKWLKNEDRREHTNR